MAFWHKHVPAAQPALVPRRERAWASLPVLQRIVEPIDPVAPREPFVASLSSHRNPSFLAPLSHVVDPNGPSGRIGGLVTPTPMRDVPHVQLASAAEPSVIRKWVNRLSTTPVISRVADTGATATRAPAVDAASSAAASETTTGGPAAPHRQLVCLPVPKLSKLRTLRVSRAETVDKRNRSAVRAWIALGDAGFRERTRDA